MTGFDIQVKRMLVEPRYSALSIEQQCDLLSLARSSFYYKARQTSQENLDLMRILDGLHLDDPTKGGRLLHQDLLEKGYTVNLKRVRRLMKIMDLTPIYPKPNLSKNDKEHEKYPYLLNNMTINHSNQVWASDITYIPMEKGFLYRVAIIDWYSRFLLGWRLSNTLSADFCIDCVESCLRKWGTPEILNTDQGSQFTATAWIHILKSNQIQISMAGKGRALDNIIIERFWRTLKYRYIYLHAFEDGWQLEKGLDAFIEKYSYKNKHQSLGYLTPAQVYLENKIPLLRNGNKKDERC